MPTLTTQQDLRKAQKLPFCYLCGVAFQPGEKPTRDHLPPSSLFAKEDRNCPLILPAHETCNAREHISDELLGELVGTLRGAAVGHRQRRLDGEVLEMSGRTVTFCQGFNVHQFLRRCIRGFHAALYGQWLPENTGHAAHPSIHCVELDGETGRPSNDFNAMLMRDAGLTQQALLTSIFKKNRFVNNTDQVVTRNGKCIYECVWSHLDDGTPICIFGLKIYEWQRCGEVLGYPNRGCVGMYEPKAGRPPNATRETRLDFPFPNKEPLDPFGY